MAFDSVLLAKKRNYLIREVDERDMAGKGQPMCREREPEKSFVCTRPYGHTGSHRARFHDGQLCCPPWRNQ